jgi:serine O-acetyltransferase
MAERFASGMLGVLFPHLVELDRADNDPGEEIAMLAGLLEQALTEPGSTPAEASSAHEVAQRLISRLGLIRERLLLDAQAIYDGDPAAHGVDEVIVAYPGFLAIGLYRIAHELHGQAPLFGSSSF